MKALRHTYFYLIFLDEMLHEGEEPVGTSSRNSFSMSASDIQVNKEQSNSTKNDSWKRNSKTDIGNER